MFLLAVVGCGIDQTLEAKDSGPVGVDSADTAVLIDTADTADTAETGETAILDTTPLPAPDILVEPGELRWSAADLGPTAQDFLVTNVGDALLTVDHLDLTVDAGTPFTWLVPDGVPFPRAVDPGMSFNVTVTYTRTTLDGSVGEVDVASDDPDEPVAPVALVADTGASLCRTDPFFTQYGFADLKKIDLYYSNGDGTFDGPLTIGEHLTGYHWSQVQIDFDGDGVNEILAVDSLTLESYVLECDPLTGEWGQRATGQTLSFAPYGFGDINGDGIVDIGGYSASLDGHTALGNGDGTFTEVAAPSWHADSADLGYRQGMTRHMRDLDGDGVADIAFYAYSTSGAGQTRIGIYSGLGDGRFRAPTTYLYTDGIGNSLDVADLDGNGYNDIVTGTDDDGDAGAGYTILDPATGATTDFEAFDVEPGLESSADAGGAGFIWIADFTEDGAPDLFVGHYLESWANPAVAFLPGMSDGTFGDVIPVLGPDETDQPGVYGP